MTQAEALDKLIEAVEAGKKVSIPTPHPIAKHTNPQLSAKIIGHVERYTALRHKGAMPFLVPTKDVIAHLKAYRARL